MRAQVSRMCSSALFVGLAYSVSLGCLLACSSNDRAPTTGHALPATKAPSLRPSSGAPAEEAFLDKLLKSVPTEREFTDKCGVDERACNTNVPRTPLDEAIADDFPAREWSKSVPYLPCAGEEECGDGFCDRGQCAPIMTWDNRWGQRCTTSRECPGLLCINGRCRSCISHAECKSKLGHSEAMCDSPPRGRYPRYCNDLRTQCTPSTPNPAISPLDQRPFRAHACPWPGSRWSRLIDSLHSSPAFVPPPRPSERVGLALSPFDTAIADTCPAQAWSRNVPDQSCTSDGQCGDGFCDRGYCKAIRTCNERLGQRCEAERHCPDLLCVEGRCRSCESNADCKKKYKNSAAECFERSLGERYCGFRFR